MKRILKVLLKCIIGLMILFVVLIFLMFSAKSAIVPDIYASTESGKTAIAVKGGYKWNSFYESIVTDSVSPEQYIYTNNNILLVAPGEKITFRNSEDPFESYNFYQLEMKYFDEANFEYLVPVPENSKSYAEIDYLTFNAPELEGMYIYNFSLSYYNKGEVSYGLKIIVSSEPNYDIEKLISYKDTRCTNDNAINKILSILPYYKNQKGIIVTCTSEYNELVINYEELIMSRDDLTNNVIALFTLIPELDTIMYNAGYNSFYFTRQEIEIKIGRLLEDYAQNLELWKQEILFKEKILDEKNSRDTIYKSIIADILAEFNDTELSKIYIDTQSFEESKVLPISNIDAQEILEYVSVFSDTVYNINYKTYKDGNYEGMIISLVDIEDKITSITENISGDNDSNQQNSEIDYDLYKDIYVCTIIVSNNVRSTLYKYEINYNNEKWNIMEI